MRRSPTKIRLHRRKTWIKYIPSPEKLHYIVIDGIDHITWATLSSLILGHLGANSSLNRKGNRRTVCKWFLTWRLLTDSQASLPNLHRQASDCGSTKETPNSNCQYSQTNYRSQVTSSEMEEEVRAIHCPH